MILRQGEAWTFSLVLLGYNMAIKRYGKTLTIDGDFVAYFDGFRRALKRPMTKQVGNVVLGYVESAIARNFANEEGSGGESWPELAESTQRSREKEGYHPRHPMLRRTDDLYDAATNGLKMSIARGGEEIEIYATFRSMATRQKFVMHNMPVGEVFVLQNDSASGASIPGREFFYLTPEDEEMISETVMAALVGEATRIARSAGAPIKQQARSNKETANKIPITEFNIDLGSLR